MENQKERLKKCVKAVEGNLEKTIIFNYKLEQFNDYLKSMVGDKN